MIKPHRKDHASQYLWVGIRTTKIQLTSHYQTGFKMHQTTATIHPRQHNSSGDFVKTSINYLPANCADTESGSHTITDIEPSDVSEKTTTFSKYRDASIEADLNNNEAAATDTCSSGAEVEGHVYTPPISQDELVQKICDAADMACKAKRVNQLMSYISGIDYSQAQNCAREAAGGNPDAVNNEGLLASKRK